jgi:hypothetical protein
MSEDFFGTEARKLVRRNDPSTSHEAAAKVDTSRLERMVYEAIKRFPNGCIADQVLAEFPGMPYSSITARFKALIDKGFVVVDGTRPGRSRRSQRVMKAV